MKSKHQLGRGEEVKALTQYENWKLKIGNTTIDISSKEVLEFIGGDNTNISLEDNVVTIDVTIPDYEKVNKIVSSSTYTILSSDITKWLVFTNDCTVTVPTGLTTPMLFEGESDGVTVTFQAASGVTLRHVASISKILSPNGVFGIRMRATNNCVLYGTDPTNYLAQ